MSSGVTPGEVALFGGSFDPPHVGHVLAVAYALSVGFQEVLVVPTLAHAFDKALTPFEHRLAMAHLAFGRLEGATISPIEARLGSPSRTLRTVEELLQQEPGRRLRLMVGADVLLERADWHRWDRIAELAPPFVLGRGGVESEEAPETVLPAVSSTAIRERLRRTPGARTDDETLSRLVPAAVLRYLDEHGLYR